MEFIVSISVLAFISILGIIKIPKLLRTRAYNEFWAFSSLVCLGIVLSALKAFEINIGNPSDLLTWIFSPFQNIMESLLIKR